MKKEGSKSCHRFLPLLWQKKLYPYSPTLSIFDTAGASAAPVETRAVLFHRVSHARMGTPIERLNCNIKKERKIRFSVDNGFVNEAKTHVRSLIASTQGIQCIYQ